MKKFSKIFFYLTAVDRNGSKLRILPALRSGINTADRLRYCLQSHSLHNPVLSGQYLHIHCECFIISAVLFVFLHCLLNDRLTECAVINTNCLCFLRKKAGRCHARKGVGFQTVHLIVII